jgi:hypothetical protein
MTRIKQSELWIGGEHVPPSSGNYFDLTEWKWITIRMS